MIKLRFPYRLLAGLLASMSLTPLLGAPASESLFQQSIRPMLSEYCFKCHSTEKQKGELDLERFSSLAEVKKHPKIWQGVIEQITSDEMPPKDQPQPAAEQEKQLLAWVHSVLNEIALERAGDPGPVVLRRLSNAEYTYTIRDLTGVEALDPAREFPVDGASGEGFMNVGNSLVMSPSLVTKYLDAAKGIASHAILLPDGIRFSPRNTRRDWTEEILAEIRAFYGQYTEKGGGSAVNLQGIQFDTRDGGVLPLEKYFAALLEERVSGANPDAAKSGLSQKYLDALRVALDRAGPSIVLGPIRARWRLAKPGDAAALAENVGQWQRELWKFNSVGHIGKVGGPKGWLESFSPLALQQEVRLKLPASPEGEVTLYLAAGDAGDGNENDFVEWKEPRLVAPGRPPLLLRDVRAVTRDLTARRARMFSLTAQSLAAAAEASAAPEKPDLAELARKHGLDADVLGPWLDYLGIAGDGQVKIDSYLTNRIERSAGYDFVNGWGTPATPLLNANASDQHVRIPGNMKPHSIAVHPSPSLQIVVGWRSPSATTVRVEGAVQHAHPECGNGVTWTLELRRGSARQRLAAGVAQGGKEVKIAPIENLAVRPGDLVSLLIGPRDGNHSCDLTAVDLVLASAGENGREWNLAKDVSPNVLSGNPHADRFGNEGVWHFYTEPDKGSVELRSVIPAGSRLAKWQAAPDAEQKRKLADEVQALLTAGPPAAKDSPDAKLHQQLSSLGGPLFAGASAAAAESEPWGLDPHDFGKRRGDPKSLYVRAPSVIEIRLPAGLVAGWEFVTTGLLDRETGAEGSVQLQALTNKPSGLSGLRPAGVSAGDVAGLWSSNNRRVSFTAPIVVQDGSAARQRIEADLDEFRQIFPAALCYTKIVPVDEVVTLTLFYREDHHFARLMLADAGRKKLERLWAEMHFVSQDALTLVDAYDQLWQFATQDADPSAFEPLREPIKQRAAAFRQLQAETEPKHLEAALEFAGRAYRRPLTDAETDQLRGLYRSLREQELPHDEAIRLTLARVLVAPAFLYHPETPGPGLKASPVNDWELANRLSFFLWSSAPDAELRGVAAAGRLRDPEVLAAQSRRMLREARTRRLATEFGCAWLHIYALDELSEKSERHFPNFISLRGAMYEESIQFFTDFFQNDRSVLSLLDADHTFLNEPLAQHYSIPGVTGPEWRRVEGLKKIARGGILGQAATLAKQSGASRTSPILRGNWVSEVLLGEKLPRPPKDVPRLPEDEATEQLTVRQLTEKHTTDPRCAGCHSRIDAFGFALEKFDAIGRRRERDLGDRPIDTRAKIHDGSEFDDIAGLRDYLLGRRGDAFLNQFCRKLLGYSLGRAVQLSDGPLLAEMRSQLKANGHRITAAVETIVRSPQFREIRGKEMTSDE